MPATNKIAKYTEPLLKDTGLYDYFELILSGDTLPKMKPDPNAAACGRRVAAWSVPAPAHPAGDALRISVFQNPFGLQMRHWCWAETGVTTIVKQSRSS